MPFSDKQLPDLASSKKSRRSCESRLIVRQKAVQVSARLFFAAGTRRSLRPFSAVTRLLTAVAVLAGINHAVISGQVDESPGSTTIGVDANVDSFSDQRFLRAACSCGSKLRYDSYYSLCQKSGALLFMSNVSGRSSDVERFNLQLPFYRH